MKSEIIKHIAESEGVREWDASVMVNDVPAPKKTFPCTIGSRTFETEADYIEALHDYLNGG